MNQDQILAVIQEAIKQGLASTLWLTALIATVAAAIGAFAGAYLKRKGEQAAVDEYFATALAQVETQTRSVERIKSDIAQQMALSIEDIRAKITKDVELFKNSLQDQLRRQSEIHAFRYSKTYGVLEKIAVLPAIDDTYLRKERDKYVQDPNLTKEVVGRESARYGEVGELYSCVRPLLEPALANEADAHVAEAARLTKAMVDALYTGSDLAGGILLPLVESRRRAEQVIRSVLERQIVSLTATAALPTAR